MAKPKAPLAITTSADNGDIQMVQFNHSTYFELREAKLWKPCRRNTNRRTIALHEAIDEGNLERIEDELRDKNAVDDLNKGDVCSGFSVLHEATRRNNAKIVKSLIEHGVEINIRSTNGQEQTPLHIAARFNCLQSASTLLSHGADPTLANSQGTTPLHYAARKGTKQMAKLFLDHSDVDINARDNSSLTPLHHACIHGNSQVVQLLLNRSADVKATSVDLLNPLHFVVNNQACKTEAVEMILKKVVSLELDVSEYVNSADQDKNTPLHLAVEASSLDAAKLCLDAGANVNCVRANSMTPLHIATLKGNLEIVSLLVDRGADVKAKDNEMKTCLHRAASFNNVEILKFLLNKRLELETADYQNRTAFLDAVACGQTTAAQFLLRAGANFFAVDVKMKNCIHLAVENQHSDTLEMLLGETGVCENLYRPDTSERVPLHYAALADNHKVLESLLAKHDKSKFISLKDESHRSPLHLSAISGLVSNVEALGRVMHGLNERDDHGHTPLHTAAMNGNSKVCKSLLHLGADVDIKDFNRWTPLMWATKVGCNKSSRVMLNNQASIDLVNNDGNTALHIACIYGRPTMINQLLDLGAQATIRNKAGQGCMDLAVAFDMPDVALALVKHGRWREIMEDKDSNGHTCMKLLIEHFPDSARLVMDKCVEQSKGAQTVTYDFHLLDPGPDDEAYLKGKRFFGPWCMVKYKRQGLLKHSLTKNLLEYKWFSFGHFVYRLNLVSYLIFVITYSVFVITQRENVVFEHTKGNTTIASSLQGYSETSFSANSLISILIVIFMVIHMIKEIIQMLTQRLRYFLELTNYLEWTLYITCLIFMLAHLAPRTKEQINEVFGIRARVSDLWILGTVSIFLSYFNLILFIRKIQSFGIYVLMFLEVTKTVIHTIAVFSIFVVAFSIVFFILFKEQESFGSFFVSIVKVSVMLVGEFEYKEVFVDSINQFKAPGRSLNPFPNTAFVFCCIFILLMAVVLINLLIGLAVGDIDSIQQNAAIKRLAMQVEFVADVEDNYPRFITRRVYKPQLVIEKNTKKHSRFIRYLLRFSDRLQQPFEREAEKSAEDDKATDHQYEKLRAQLSKAQKRIKALVSVIESQNTLLRGLSEKLDPCESGAEKVPELEGVVERIMKPDLNGRDASDDEILP